MSFSSFTLALFSSEKSLLCFFSCISNKAKLKCSRNSTDSPKLPYFFPQIILDLANKCGPFWALTEYGRSMGPPLACLGGAVFFGVSSSDLPLFKSIDFVEAKIDALWHSFCILYSDIFLLLYSTMFVCATCSPASSWWPLFWDETHACSFSNS